MQCYARNQLREAFNIVSCLSYSEGLQEEGVRDEFPTNMFEAIFLHFFIGFLAGIVRGNGAIKEDYFRLFHSGCDGHWGVGGEGDRGI